MSYYSAKAATPTMAATSPRSNFRSTAAPRLARSAGDGSLTGDELPETGAEEEAAGVVDAPGAEVMVLILSAGGERSETDAVGDVQPPEPVLSEPDGLAPGTVEAPPVGVVVAEVTVTGGTVMGTPAELQRETTAEETAALITESALARQ